MGEELRQSLPGIGRTVRHDTGIRVTHAFAVAPGLPEGRGRMIIDRRGIRIHRRAGIRGIHPAVVAGQARKVGQFLKMPGLPSMTVETEGVPQIDIEFFPERLVRLVGLVHGVHQKTQNPDAVPLQTGDLFSGVSARNAARKAVADLVSVAELSESDDGKQRKIVRVAGLDQLQEFVVFFKCLKAADRLNRLDVEFCGLRVLRAFRKLLEETETGVIRLLVVAVFSEFGNLRRSQSGGSECAQKKHRKNQK